MLVVPVSGKFYKYQTVYKKVKTFQKFQCLVFLKCNFLNVGSQCI